MTRLSRDIKPSTALRSHDRRAWHVAGAPASGAPPRSHRASAAELITEIADLEALIPEWDALAPAASNPVATPAWVLSWWHHVAGQDLQPRLVTVRDRGRLIGVGPFYVASERHGVVDYRLMGGDFGVRMEPLALPGREWDVAVQFARALASVWPRPDTITFGPMALSSSWTTALRSGWPGVLRGPVRQFRIVGEPVAVLREPTFEAWFSSLGPTTRRSLRREQRLFERAGGTIRWSTATTLRQDAETFARLHRARWSDRGRSRLAALGHRLPDWVEALGNGLIDTDRFRLCVLELDGSPICTDLHLLAGEESIGVNMGWDERYARLAPGKLATLHAVQDAYGRRCRRVSLGFGEQPYKLMFANGNHPVAWSVFMAPSLGLSYTYAHAFPGLLRERTRDVAERTLPSRWFEALRAVRRRIVA